MIFGYEKPKKKKSKQRKKGGPFSGIKRKVQTKVRQRGRRGLGG